MPWTPYPELAEVLAGAAPGRATPDEITLFMNNFGIGIQFAALGAVAYEGARARGLGRDLPDDWFLETIRPVARPRRGAARTIPGNRDQGCTVSVNQSVGSSWPSPAERARS